MRSTLITSAFMAIATCAHASPTLERDGVVTTPDGRSLYTFDKDGAGKSTCYGGCATAWPPFLASDANRVGGGYSVVARDDGSRQWAYKGMPLYLFAGDARPGDAKGDKQGGVWHLLRTAGAAASPFSHSGY